MSFRFFINSLEGICFINAAKVHDFAYKNKAKNFILDIKK